MNLKTLLARSLLACAILSAAVFALPSPTVGQTAGTSYYWVASRSTTPTGARQGFVVAVDATKAAQIEAIFADGGLPGLGGTIVAGTVDYNKDYFSPDHRVWNWHYTDDFGVFDFRTTLFPACMCPSLVANPSDIAVNPEEWISENGGYTPIGYDIVGRIDPSQRSSMANVSNRGLTGSGERTLITGLIIKGGEPRTVVVRALGPSLSSSGLQEVAGNPRLVVHREGTLLTSNSDWKAGSRADELVQKYPMLAPSNDKEAALLLTLLPGSYTLQGINEDGTEGVVLLEAYDVDSSLP
jgi:hypothetical protein